MSHPIRIEDDKPTVATLEHAADVHDTKANIVSDDIPVSPFKDLPRRKALWVYRKAVLISVLIAWSAIMDGYLVSSEFPVRTWFSGRFELRLVQSLGRLSPTNTLSLSSVLSRLAPTASSILCTLVHGPQCNLSAKSLVSAGCPSSLQCLY